MTRKISISVNESPLSLDYFVQGFVDHAVGGMVAGLEGTGKIETLDIDIDGKDVKMNLNGAPLRMKPFVSDIFRSTLLGMVSSLKEVDETNRINISISR